MAVTLAEYNKLVEERPRKFSPEDIGYRESDSKERCGRCFHFYERKIDNRATCEIMRSEETDEEGVDPDFVCCFHTRDGENFPLLKEETSDDED